MKRNEIRSGLSRKERHERFAVKDWVNRLPNVPAFIIGCSPSASEIDFSLLSDYFTIGINRSYQLIDPTILMWQDITFWNTEHTAISSLQALKVARDIADPKRLYYNFYLKSSLDYQFSEQTYVLYGRGSSGPLAVELAVAMGCSPIVLIGMDCQTEEDKTDFYGRNIFWTEYTVSACTKGLEFIRDKCPVPIKNCGNSSFWPKERLEDILKQISPSHKRGREAYTRQILNRPI